MQTQPPYTSQKKSPHSPHTKKQSKSKLSTRLLKRKKQTTQQNEFHVKQITICYKMAKFSQANKSIFY